MNISGIKLHSPQTLDEALKLLWEIKDAQILAGGTDLLVDLKQGLIEAKNLISLQNIEILKGIERKDEKIKIGSLVTPQEIIYNSLFQKNLPALVDAAQAMASPQIRNMATIGGNIASAVPSADLPPPLIAADAAVELRCAESKREIPLYKFFSGPRETICRKNELLTSISFLLPPPNTGISFEKFALREANALAVASAASRLTLTNGKISKAAVVLGAVAPIPLLASKATKCLLSEKPSQELFEKAASIAQKEARPISDLRGSVWFRKELVYILTKKTLSKALTRAQERSLRGK